MDLLTETMSPYENYVRHLQQVADFRYAAAVLQWDQEVYMPEAGAAARSRQLATLAEEAHRRFTDPSFGRLLDSLAAAGTGDSFQQKNIERSRYDFGQQSKLPASFVRTLSETVSLAFQSWLEARKANDFSRFAPLLDKLIGLKKQEADLLGFEGHPYNALLNQYEPGCTTTLLDATFSALQEPLRQLIRRIGDSPQVDDSLLHGFFPETDQWAFSLELLEKMGFDGKAGRQDKSAHPFTTNFCSRDVRITTRVDENDLANLLYSTIHELGHALYEQGLPDEQYGLPLGEYTSLSIHESQSRFWENNIARNLPWCRHFLPVLQGYFPEQFRKATAEELFRAVNKVSPSLIRTEADELTYHFHIIIRYEIEKALIGGEMKTGDIPRAWKEAYQKYLGLEVPDDRRGALQDVHWSHGSFGYFPTYSLGSLYAAQFYAAAGQVLTGLESALEQGNFAELLQWLRDRIHRHGRFYTSEELCRCISGEGINSRYFMQYVTDKFRFIYALQKEGVS